MKPPPALGTANSGVEAQKGSMDRYLAPIILLQYWQLAKVL
ncbi:hypothetical protein GGR91_002260 [Sphingorhabdus rigui]|uniref:Uncharacterized protein n=1 Tax=Sphingorhabdus rigui TaxID=1282858 RepID=A0A840B224_9SPHN|nr:hypothetical protein [Sphingorhabdus rigui]